MESPSALTDSLNYRKHSHKIPKSSSNNLGLFKHEAMVTRVHNPSSNWPKIARTGSKFA
jgi:hypothetical protein